MTDPFFLDVGITHVETDQVTDEQMQDEEKADNLSPVKIERRRYRIKRC